MEYNSTFFGRPCWTLRRHLAFLGDLFFAGQAMTLVLKPKSVLPDQGPTQVQISSERSPLVSTKPSGQTTLPQTAGPPRMPQKVNGTRSSMGFRELFHGNQNRLGRNEATSPHGRAASRRSCSWRLRVCTWRGPSTRPGAQGQPPAACSLWVRSSWTICRGK